ncbi:hypothetical protein LWI28_003845 [Acer negundo]|uniref:Uncharacterized protein n=1 Tax=Acer negundo TaxID=4023 RepID=A0AAD5NEY3_ACENE|nr:hypothetical protein LWI28_003845 [Acer negundo]KAK4834300.1 hypothetical protein QYF36_020430 [Acer negundo]
MEDGLQDINLSLRGEEDVEEKRETAEVEGGGGEERRSGGLLDNLIHNLVSPLSPKTVQKRVDEEEKVFERSENESSKRTKTEKDHVVGDGTGGLIKNVISNLFHSNEAQNEKKNNNEEEEEEEVVKVVEENGKVKTEEEEGGGGGGGGGFIDNIVSHLPASLLDDRAAPTTDEASILIHSIIHD